MLSLQGVIPYLKFVMFPNVMFTKNTYVLLTITPTSFVTNPKYFQTLLFTLVARCLWMSSRVVCTTCATVDRFCVTNLVFHFSIKILKLRHAHACASINIKSFYIGIVIVSSISIYWYIDIYRTSLVVVV